jgi:hypothetical protein
MTRTPRITNARKRAFLDAVGRLGTIHAACRDTGIARSTHYEWVARDPEYVVALREAEDVAIEAMEGEARRRAVLGTSKPVYQGGRQVGDVTEYSDTLMVFLLKALRPDKYRERVDLTVDIRREAEKLAAEAGLDTEALIAEADRIVAAARTAG